MCASRPASYSANARPADSMQVGADSGSGAAERLQLLVCFGTGRLYKWEGCLTVCCI